MLIRLQAYLKLQLPSYDIAAFVSANLNLVLSLQQVQEDEASTSGVDDIPLEKKLGISVRVSLVPTQITPCTLHCSQLVAKPSWAGTSSFHPIDSAELVDKLYIQCLLGKARLSPDWLFC